MVSVIEQTPRNHYLGNHYFIYLEVEKKKYIVFSSIAFLSDTTFMYFTIAACLFQFNFNDMVFVLFLCCYFIDFILYYKLPCSLWDRKVESSLSNTCLSSYLAQTTCLSPV